MDKDLKLSIYTRKNQKRYKFRSIYVSFDINNKIDHHFQNYSCSIYTWEDIIQRTMVIDPYESNIVHRWSLKICKVNVP